MLRRLALCALLLSFTEARQACSCSCCRAELSRASTEEGQEGDFDAWQCTYAPALASAASACEELCDVGGTTPSFFRLLSASSVATDMQRFCFQSCAPQRRALAGPSDTGGEIDDICGPLRPGQAPSSFLTPHHRAQSALLLKAKSSSGASQQTKTASLDTPESTEMKEQLAAAEKGTAQILKLAEEADGLAKDVGAEVGKVKEVTTEATDVLLTGLADLAKAKNAAKTAHVLELQVRSVLAEVRVAARNEALAMVPTVLAEERKKAEAKAMEGAEKMYVKQKDEEWKETIAEAKAEEAKADEAAGADAKGTKADAKTDEGAKEANATDAKKDA